MSDLLPCPFCGERLEHHADLHWWVHPATNCVAHNIAIVEGREDRIAGWNRRAAVPPPPAPAPEHEKDLMAVGRASSQIAPDGSRSSPATVPSTTEEKP